MFGKKVTIGYKYHLGMHMVVCIGPVDEVQQIIVGDRIAWEGTVTTSQQIQVDAPELFGGEKKEGGIVGSIDVMMGEIAQGKNDYLQGQLGAVIPAFRGVLSFVLRQVYVSAMSPYPKPWAFKIKRLAAKSWYPATADINGSANPAHMIYEALTNTDWGLGYPNTAIDDAAFVAAADTLYAEGLGMSLTMNKSESTERFIYMVLGHCNGMVYGRPDNGLFTLKLIRDDYVFANLPIADESNIISLESFERPGFGEIVNEIVVVYRPQGKTEDDSVTVQDLASIQAQGGVVSQTINYPGIDTAPNATRIAMRDLRQKATPFARVKIRVNRRAWNVGLGDVFRLNWTGLGLVDLVFRVMKIDYGTLESGEITVDAVEDVFALPSATYLGNQTSQWTDPIIDPIDFTNRKLLEVPYFELAQAIQTAEFDKLTATSAFMMAMMGEPSHYIQGYALWTRPAGIGNFIESDPTSDATPTAAVAVDAAPADIVINVSNFTGGVQFVETGTWALLGDEIVRIDAIDRGAGTVTVGRGCLDTTPKAHTVGTLLYFAENFYAADPEEYAQGESRDARALQRTATGLLDILDATTETLAFVGRQNRPYPPGAFLINSNYYPVKVMGKLSSTWSHRDRLQQLVKPIIDHQAGGIGPEAGVTYTVTVYASDGITILRQDTGISVTAWSWTNEETENTSGTNRLTVESVRGGVSSFQKNDWTVERAGLGNNLGNYLGGF